MPHLLWVSAPQNQRPKLESSLPLELVSVDFWTGCYSLDWWQTELGSIYFEEDENLFPIIFLITERVFEVHNLGFKTVLFLGPLSQGKGQGGARGDKEKGMVCS